MNELSRLDVGGTAIAYRFRPGRSPTLVFLPGYASDMDGAKAVALDSLAERLGLAMLRFDYSGTGSSSGRFEDGTLDRWLGESLHLLDSLVAGPAVVIGSSMGGWLALHVALRRPQQIVALVGIAAAPDFTHWGFTAQQTGILRSLGKLEEPNPYGGDPFVTYLGFWQSGEAMRLLDSPIAIDCPVRLVHGDKDGDVPVEIAVRLKDRLRSADVQLTIVKDAGHRLSEPNSLAALVRIVQNLVEPRQ